MEAGLRKLRALTLIAVAVIAAGTVSLVSLKPPPQKPVAAPAPAQSSGPSVQSPFSLQGRTDGGFFVWVRDQGASGGHAG